MKKILNISTELKSLDSIYLNLMTTLKEVGIDLIKQEKQEKSFLTIQSILCNIATLNLNNYGNSTI